MPLSKDPRGGGSEANGTKNLMYCSHCYQKGKFVLPDISVDQMVERVKTKMKAIGFPGFMAGFFTRRIPKLERWTKPIHMEPLPGTREEESLDLR